MATYFALADIIGPGGSYITAGQTFTDANAPGWIPATPMLDPLDAPAVQAYWAVGPQLPGLIRTQFVGNSVRQPITYWIPNPNPTLPGNPGREYVLTGPIAAALGLGFQQAKLTEFFPCP
jgi:hypothetical protein